MFDRVLKAAVLAAGLALAGCPGPQVRPNGETDDAPARAALQAFLEAEQAQDFTRVYVLLAAPWRSKYTPERLQTDFARDQELANDKLARIRAALASGAALQLHGDRAELPLGGDRAVRLVNESGAWHVLALE